MFIVSRITKWESHRDGKGRVSAIDRPLGRTFLINPNRIVDLTVCGTGSKFKFYDNHLDERENFSYVESASTVAELRTAIDTDTSSLFITLPLYKNNKIGNHTTDTTISIEFIAYFDAYRPNPPNATWVIYIKNGFKRVEALCNLSLEAIYNLLVVPESEGGEGDFNDPSQYVLFSDDEGMWRKGARNGSFCWDKTLTGLGFLGIENIDWENVKKIS